MAYLIPVIHPAAVLRGTRPVGEAISADLGKAYRISQGDGPNLTEHIIHVVPGNPLGLPESFKRALAWLESWASRPCRVGVDVETSALDYFNCKLYSISLAEAETSTAVAFTAWDLHTLPPSYEMALERALAKVLAAEHVEKVFHNAPFDLAVLYRRGYHVGGKYWDTQGLHHLIQPDIPHDLGWVGHTYLDVEPWKLDHQSGKMANTKDPVELLIYNAKDALYTAMLVEPMLEHISALGMSPTLASWQAEYARLATDMENYGIPINFDKRRARAKMMRDRMAQKRAWIRDFLKWPDFNPMADVHRREALYGKKYASEPWNLCLQPSKYTKKTGKTSTSYKAIIDHLEHPFVRALADYVETHMAYATQFRDGTLLNLDGKREAPGGYERAICSDGRIHPRWKPNTLRSVRYGSDPNCFSADTELLTVIGWVPFPEAHRRKLRPIEYDPHTDTAKATSERYSYVQQANVTDWVEVKTQSVDILMTGLHRCLLLYQNETTRQWHAEVTQAAELPALCGKHPHVPTRAGTWEKNSPVKLSHAEISILCACQADGWRRKYGKGEAWAFYLTKKRKLVRLTEALRTLGSAAVWYAKPIPRNGVRACRKQSTAVYLKDCPLKEWIDSLLTDKSKSFGPWLLDWSADDLRYFVQEVTRWDGRVDRGSEYSTVNKTNADWVQIAAVLSGEKAGHVSSFFGPHSKTPCYQVSAGRPKRWTGIRKKHVSKFTHEGMPAHCITVSTGFIIVRRNGKAHITGNCQNQKALSPGADPITCDRVMFEAAPGRTFVGADKDQLELRIHACRAGEKELLDEMRREGGDPHTLACKMVYGETFTKESKKGQKMLRTIMKNVVYASLYLAGVTTVWRTIRERKALDPAVRASMTPAVVRHAHSSYFMHFAQINKYNEWLIQEATTKGYIEIPPFGRRRYFPIKPVQGTEVCNWTTQCCGAEIVTSEMCEIQYELKRRYKGRASVIAHKHDELNVECDEKDAEDIAKLIKQVFGSTKLDGPAGPVYLTADTNIANNMATLK